MEPQEEKIKKLMEKGVYIPNPVTVFIGDEVDINNISGDGVVIYPGCRLFGKNTVISKGVKLGYEAPVTIEDCQLDENVELKGGYFKQSVFLEKVSMGLGAHVREGCILEEESSGAHCVGLKHTILFPFVTLGSLINFCDCFMAGGTSRRDHSEVGSSFIHFNFTPEGDKATPSLIGDVPRGVMLNKPRIFLGGQGGIVGPVRIGFGNVVAAGSIIRKDYPVENKLILSASEGDLTRDIPKKTSFSINRIVKNNIIYISNLTALGEWYRYVRKPFLIKKEFGSLIYDGLMEKIGLAKNERLKRLREFLEKHKDQRPELYSGFDKLEKMLRNQENVNYGMEEREIFLNAVNKKMEEEGLGYIEFIKSLPYDTAQYGTKWLDKIIINICADAEKIFPSLSPILR